MEVFAVSAGASRRRCRRHDAASASCRSTIEAVVLAIAVVMSAGCAGDEPAPDRLMDGSQALPSRVELEGVEGPAVLTQLRIVSPSEREGTRSMSCLAKDWDVPPQGASVERVGVTSESVTFEEGGRRAVFGCDNGEGTREGSRSWCGSAYGTLFGGRLRDPRLDLGGCRTADGRPIAFVWVQPGRGTSYLAVRQPGYAEIYRPARGLPVRIATTRGLSLDPLGATVEYSEHDTEGRLLRSRALEAVPAG
jgi:hypothetical protein